MKNYFKNIINSLVSISRKNNNNDLIKASYSSNLYKNVFEQIGESIIIFKNSSGKILDTNNAFCDNICNKSKLNFISETISPEFWNQLNLLKKDQTFEYYINNNTYEIHKNTINNKSNVCISVFYNITEKKNNEIITKEYSTNLEKEVKIRTKDLYRANIDFIKEINEKRKIQEQLSYNEIKFRNIIEKSPDGVVIVNNKGKILNWNKGQEKITGLSEKNISDKFIWDLQYYFLEKKNKTTAYFENLKRRMQSFMDSSSEDNPNSFFLKQVSIFLPNGTEKILQSLVFTIPLKDEILFVNFNRDLTKQIKTEKVAQKYKEKLNAFFTNSFHPFVIINKNLDVVSYNKNASDKLVELYDITLTDKINLSDFSYLPLFNEIINKIKQSLKGKSIRYEIEIIDKNNNISWYELHISPIFSDKNKIEEVFINPINIDENKKAQKEIIQLLKKERELNELRSQFIATVSHEFRTPMSNIYSNTQLLEKFNEKWDTNKKDKSFSRIYDAINNITMMLNDISELGKEESGQLKYNPSLIDINGFTSTIIEELEELHNLSYKIKLNTNSIKSHINGDANLLRQILINLINNSIKYTLNNPKISINISNTNHQISFKIRDNGIGIPIKDQETIFIPFQRGSNTEHYKGSGLGLSIVKKCIELHNGNYTINSQLRQGTEFCFSIPQ